jgi:hypothetical protein
MFCSHHLLCPALSQSHRPGGAGDGHLASGRCDPAAADPRPCQPAQGIQHGVLWGAPNPEDDRQGPLLAGGAAALPIL